MRKQTLAEIIKSDPDFKRDWGDVVATLKKTGGKYDAMNGLIEAWGVPSTRLMQCYHAVAL